METANRHRVLMPPVSPRNIHPEGKPLAISPELTPSFVGQRLQQVIHSLESQYGNLGIKFSTKKALQEFYEFDMESQSSILFKVENFFHFLNQMTQEEMDLHDNRKNLEFLLRGKSLRVSNEFMDALSENDVLEIYDSSFIQTHRNLRCLECTSYDVLTLSSHDWPFLFKRDASITEALFLEAQEILTKVHPLYEFQVEKHLMIERFGKKRRMLTKNKYGATIINGSNDIVGLVATLEATLIDDRTDSIEFLRSH